MGGFTPESVDVKVGGQTVDVYMTVVDPTEMANFGQFINTISLG